MNIRDRFLTWIGTMQGFGSCGKCGRTWNCVKGHETYYEENRAMFPMCKECYAESNNKERLFYHLELVSEWARQDPLVLHENYPEIKKTLEEIFKEG